MNPFDGKVSVVTGAGRGIGRATALLLAGLGSKVVVNDPGVSMDGSGRDQSAADMVVSEINDRGGVAVANYDSVATIDGGENAIKTALDAFGRLDILVNVAGILRDRMIFNMTEEDWDSVIAVHLKGHFACTRAAAQVMRQQRSGRIINFSSESGTRGNAGQANYGAAKSGVAGFTRVVARDLGPYHITCNAIVPRAWTRMTEALPALRPGETGASAEERLKHMAPEMVAPMVAFLASDAAWNINGQMFLVYAGTVALLKHPVPQRTLHKRGAWSVDELIERIPGLMEGVVNPAPPSPDVLVPGREMSEARRD
jgi:NAD(P)-dependent dehydrogenase (short-subunit alcohol dehydrogenase family)